LSEEGGHDRWMEKKLCHGQAAVLSSQLEGGEESGAPRRSWSHGPKKGSWHGSTRPWPR
jgi:hypothetical protein